MTFDVTTQRWLLLSVDDADELYSYLVYSHPRTVTMPDRGRWKVWVFKADPGLVLNGIYGSVAGRYVDAETFAEASSTWTAGKSASR